VIRNPLTTKKKFTASAPKVICPPVSRINGSGSSDPASSA